MGIYVVIAVMLMLPLLQAGMEREATLRCVACGARHGEKHHRDCQYKNKT